MPAAAPAPADIDNDEPNPAITALAAVSERAFVIENACGGSCKAQLPQIVITHPLSGVVIVSSRCDPSQIASKYNDAMASFKQGNAELMRYQSTNMRVQIKALTGRITTLNVNDEWTVCALNILYAEIMQCSIDRHWYMCSTAASGGLAKALSSEQTLRDAGIRDGSTITAMHTM